MSRDEPDPRVQEAIDNLAVAEEAWQPQIDLELSDLNFTDNPDGQWPAEIRDQRKGATIAGIPIPARPCITIDLLDQPIQQTVNNARAARLAVQVSPKGDEATQQTAETIQGLYRNIEVESDANAVRMWALERAAKCGRGFYRILADYANDGDDLQDLRLERFLNQGSVYPDPFYQRQDMADIEWCVIPGDMAFKRYQREHPDSELADYTPSEFMALGSAPPEWMGGDEPGKSVRVAEYYYVEHGAPVKQPNGRITRSRTVKWCKVNAIEVLEERTLDCRFIPVVLVIGKETNVNGVRRYSGIVRKAKEPQRAFNYMRTKEIEAIALAPQSPWMAAEGQFEGYERQMAEANLRGFPYMYYRPKSFANGQLAPPPQRQILEPAIQALSMSANAAREDVHATTGVYQPALGEMSHAGQSGKAIQNLKASSEQGTSNYLDSLASISMPHEARIIIDWMPHVYDTPGRIVRILTGDNDAAKAVMINQPFTSGPNGQPIPAQPGQAGAQTFDLSKGQYSVVVSVGKSTQTRRVEGAEMMGQLAEAVPQMVPMYADLWVGMMDFPGHREIADRFKKMLPPQLQEQTQGQDPAQLQQQLGQMQMQIQQLQPLADDNQAKLELKKMDLQAKQMEIDQRQKELEAGTQLKAATEQAKIELEHLKLQVELGLAQIKAQGEAFKASQQAHMDAAQQQHQAGTAAAAHEKDLRQNIDMAHTAHVHERQMADHEVANRPPQPSGAA